MRKTSKNQNINVCGIRKPVIMLSLEDMYTTRRFVFSRCYHKDTKTACPKCRYFDPEKLGVNPMPNPNDGTVDIEYVVEERLQ